MQHPSRNCACRRELNSHDAAKPQSNRLLSLRPRQRMASEQRKTEAKLCQLSDRQVRNRSMSMESPAGRLGAAVPHRTSGLRGKRRSSFSSSGRRCRQCQPRPGRVRRLEYVASNCQQRGAGGFSTKPRKVTGPWQARSLWLYCAVLPNPSLKRSPNGGPLGPSWWYGVHFHQPGPGVLPSSPA